MSSSPSPKPLAALSLSLSLYSAAVLPGPVRHLLQCVSVSSPHSSSTSPSPSCSWGHAFSAQWVQCTGDPIAHIGRTSHQSSQSRIWRVPSCTLNRRQTPSGGPRLRRQMACSSWFSSSSPSSSAAFLCLCCHGCRYRGTVEADRRHWAPYICRW